jgi:hypothetical protein
MRLAPLAPGKLAGLISALYEASAGSPPEALHKAAASSSLKVLATTQQVAQHLNPYNISAALLVPDAVKLSCTAGHLKQNSSSSSSSSSSSFFTSASTQAPTPIPLSPAHHQSTANLSHPRLSPVYLIITGINAGLDQHIQAARQLYSQADFFVCAPQGSFWSWAARQLQHGPAVPDLVQQPLQAIVRPWVLGLAESCMPQLVQQGYDGIEVSRGGLCWYCLPYISSL